MKSFIRIITIAIEGIFFISALLAFRNEARILSTITSNSSNFWPSGYIFLTSVVTELLIIFTSPIVIFNFLKNKPNKWKWFILSKAFLLIPAIVLVIFKIFFN